MRTMFLYLASELGGVAVPQQPSPHAGLAKTLPETLTEAWGRFVETLVALGKSAPWPQKPLGSAAKMTPAEVKVFPQRGLVHPTRRGANFVFESPNAYLEWFWAEVPGSREWPVAGLLLYRKHVISELGYVAELVEFLEARRFVPLPLFTAGVDAHIAVRDLFTSKVAF